MDDDDTAAEDFLHARFAFSVAGECSDGVGMAVIDKTERQNGVDLASMLAAGAFGLVMAARCCRKPCLHHS